MLQGWCWRGALHRRWTAPRGAASATSTVYASRCDHRGEVRLLVGLLDCAVAHADSPGNDTVHAAIEPSWQEAHHHRDDCHCTEQERLPCRAVVRGRRQVVHDFAAGGPCIVRLELAVRNCLRQAASVSVEAGPQRSASSDGEAPT